MAVASLLLAVAASAFVLFAPTGKSERGSVVLKPGGERIERTHEVESTTLVEEEPGPALTVVAIALVLTGAPLTLNHTRFWLAARTVSAVVLWIGSLLAGFSIGLFYLPSAIAMTIAAARRE